MRYDVFDPSAFTAAHKTLPFGTQLTVTYHGRSAQVTVNDRGPMRRAGEAWVDYTVTGRGGYGARQAASYGADRRAARASDYRNHRHAGWRNAASRADAGSGSYHVVRPGDTLWRISSQLGSSVHRLAAANGIADPDVISVGQRIYY